MSFRQSCEGQTVSPASQGYTLCATEKGLLSLALVPSSGGWMGGPCSRVEAGSLVGWRRLSITLHLVALGYWKAGPGLRICVACLQKVSPVRVPH